VTDPTNAEIVRLLEQIREELGRLTEVVNRLQKS
jgi:hypothetical protein